MLSLTELSRVARVIDERFSGHRVERWVQPDGVRVAVRLYGREEDESERGEKAHLLFCCDPDLARASRLRALPRAPETPPRFSSFLKAHLTPARVRGAEILGGDRQLVVHLETREGRFDLLLSIFGRRSNVYVLDGNGQIVASLRSLRDTRPELQMGEPYRGPEGRPPQRGEDRYADCDDESLLGAIEDAYAEREREQGASDLSRRLKQALAKEQKSAARRLGRLEAELAEAEKANEVQRHGELLKGALGRIEPGAASIDLEDYETGETVTIPLDPKLSPRANLEATFKRYQKFVRRLTKAGGQIDEARASGEQLARLAAELETLDADAERDPASETATTALEGFASRPELARLLGKARPKARGPGKGAEPAARSQLPPRLRDLPTRLLPRRYRSADGLEIWVGRSDEANDYLTTRLARGNDLFFHLDGAPGSHVILRTEGRTDPPQESLLDACELSVHYSKQRNASRADVHVVPIKQVKKPKGAKRGLVWVTGGKSVHLRREEKRLRRVLDSRIED